VISLSTIHNCPVVALSITTMCMTFHWLIRLVSLVAGRLTVFASILFHGKHVITRIIARILSRVISVRNCLSTVILPWYSVNWLFVG